MNSNSNLNVHLNTSEQYGSGEETFSYNDLQDAYYSGNLADILDLIDFDKNNNKSSLNNKELFLKQNMDYLVSNDDNGTMSYFIYGLILSEMTHKITVLMNPLLIMVGVTVNLLVISIFSRSELRKLSISMHTISLAISDMCLLLVPILLSVIREQKPNHYLFQTNSWCKVYGYFDVAFCSWSAWNIVFLSNDRWNAICKPSTIYVKDSKRPTLMIVLAIPLVSLIMFSWYPFLFETSVNRSLNFDFELREHSSQALHDDQDFLNVAYSNTSGLFHNVTHLLTCKPKNTRMFLILGLFGICFAYFLPFALIAFYNFRIVKTLNVRIQKRRDHFSKFRLHSHLFE